MGKRSRGEDSEENVDRGQNGGGRIGSSKGVLLTLDGVYGPKKGESGRFIAPGDRESFVRVTIGEAGTLRISRQLRGLVSVFVTRAVGNALVETLEGRQRLR